MSKKTSSISHSGNNQEFSELQTRHMLHSHLQAITSPLAHQKNIIRFADKRITVLTPCLFRIEESETGVFCDEATQAVWFRDMSPVVFRIEQQKEELKVITEKLTLIIRDKIENSSVVFQDGTEQMLSNKDNLLGTYRTLDCCDGDYWFPYGGKREEGHTITLENGVISRTGVALYDDSKSLILSGDGKIVPRGNEETDIYVFAYGRDYRGALKALYRICGTTPLLPRFALGNWWSRYHAYTEEEYLEKMDGFADKDIPFTVATVDMDWHWSENMPGNVSGWTGYSWNTNLFPDYERFLKSLHERNLYVTLNLHPADGVRSFEDMYEDMAEHMGLNPESKETIPFDMSKEEFINAYFDVLHKPYEKKGVDFWWIDWQQGEKSTMEGLDPLWALNHYHYLDIAKEKDALILSRYAGIGSHRYPIGFSGDTHVTWDTLKYLPYFTATASNCGYTWWSHDIGGHMFGIKDDELFVRFIQFGVFSPINRLHSTKNPTFSKEPSMYKNGSGLIAREFLKLRHAMIPFLYSAACETTEQGLALIEPMYYEYPCDDEAYKCPGQYFFGRQMIVAPITERSSAYGMATKKVWLPEGTWTDVFTGDAYQGGRWLDMTRYTDTFPLLAKAGGFFVLDGKINGNKIELPEVLRIMSFQGNGSYKLYEDKDGHRATTLFCSEYLEDKKHKITICEKDEHGILPIREFRVELRNILNGEIEVLENGKSVDFRVRRGEYITVILPNVNAESMYEIIVNEVSTEEQKKQKAIQRILTEFEMCNDEKNNIYSRICETKNAEEYKKVVQNSNIHELYKLRLMEVSL